MAYYHFSRVSGNRKTGPIPVTTTSADSCPPNCSFRGNVCYAESGPLALHWKAVDEGQRGCTFRQLCLYVQALPRHQLWRHNQAGDLTPLAPGVIDARLLGMLAIANRGRRGFTYTHYPPTRENLRAVRRANQMRFTVNWSAETLAQADEFAALGAGPVVVTLPIGTEHPVTTPGGVM